VVAIWRLGAVHVPLFTAFGPEAARYRIAHCGARLVITDTTHRGKVMLEGLTVMTVADPEGGSVADGDLNLADAAAQGPHFEGVTRSADDLMIILYTSGTTGHPKGVRVPVRSLASVHSYMCYGLDLRPDDVFWNVSDPGWGYGLWYGLVGPLLLGHANLWRGQPFDAERVFASILSHGVTNLAGAPTAYRVLRAAGAPERLREQSRLRVASSAGEPLDSELLEWSRRELGVAIYDHYGQSELGMVIGVQHHPALQRDPVAGSMGHSAPGFRAAVVDDNGREVDAKTVGELAIDVGASSLFWFCGYHNDADRTAERFRHGPGLYLTADSAWMDRNGLLHFVSRADEVITSSGYRIGPFEVESALAAHEAVAEAAVIGVPDTLRGEAVAAFIVTTPGIEGTAQLGNELQAFVKARLAKHLFPRHVYFVDALPRTPSGKVQRKALRECWQRQHVAPEAAADG
jgi:acetyl-CoA synthetase